ncbi:MAG: ImmA/IrrE family metallo-endopeptidase [Candidatus Methanomethylicaceae archaeon]
MERRQAWLRQYLTEQGYEPLPFVRSAQLSTPPEQIALDIRRTLGLDEAWAAKQPNWTAALRELQTRIEAARITVAASSIVGNHPRRRLDPTEFRGFVLVDEYAPLVFLNSADFKAAQMFTLAHELAHIWLGTSAAFDLRHLQPAKDKTEQLCDRAAAEFLVPASELRDIWPSVAPQADPFQAIARRFKVSAIVAARRALDLKLITKETFYAFYDKYQERQRHVTGRGKERGNFYATQTVRLGRFFSKTVIQAVRQGSLLYHDAYRLTGLYGRTFDRFVNYLTGPLP